MLQHNYIWFLLLFIGGEIVATGIFYILKTLLGVKSSGTLVALCAGITERFVLFTGLVLNVQQVVIMFGALKIGTMLNEKKTEPIRSEYFLIGNFISVLLALTYYYAYTKVK